MNSKYVLWKSCDLFRGFVKRMADDRATDSCWSIRSMAVGRSRGPGSRGNGDGLVLLQTQQLPANLSPRVRVVAGESRFMGVNQSGWAFS
jgi:hypothetical protein